MDAVKEFNGEFDFLSNFFLSPFVANDKIHYKTVEHYYQAQKSQDKWEKRKIANAFSPGQAKYLGRAVKMDANEKAAWESRKLDVMRYALRKKFEKPELRERLIATHPMNLFEGNDWGDKFWGRDKFTHRGNNILGQLLMELRDLLMKTESSS